MEISRMRRRDREIKDNEEIIKILNKQNICHLAMCADDQPYVIPMIFAYEANALYFHCAEVGMKLDILRRNNKVCFEVQHSNTEKVIENTHKPCDWGISYESIVGFGMAEILNDRVEKIKAYNLLVDKLKPTGYEHRDDLYTDKKINGTFIIKVNIDSMTGKRWDGLKPNVI